MSITLYAAPHSPNSRKVHWALEELGIPYSYTTIDLGSGAHKAPDYVAINPNGRVPTLKDGELVVWESNAILAYLGDAYGAEKIFPKDARKRAQVYQWLSWQTSDLGTAVGKPWLMKLVQSFGAPFDAAAFAAAGEEARPTVALLDKHLKGRKFIANDGFSVADIACTETIGLMDVGGIPVAGFPNLASYFKGMSERPAFQKTRPRA